MRLALAFVFIFMYTINFAQEIVHSSNWATSIKQQVIPKKRSLVLNNGNIQDSVMYSKYYKLRNVDKGQLTLDIMLKKVRPLSGTPVRFNIAVIGGNKSYNSLYYYSSIPPNKISTKIYIPFDLGPIP